MGNHSTPSSARRQPTRRRAIAGLGALALAGGMVAFGAPSANAAPTTVTFTSGGNYLLHLPAGPVTVDFTILAAGGGADGDATHAGGYGGGIVGSFTWNGGKVTLSIVVGKAGGDGGPSGTNTKNGGRGGGFNSSNLFAPSLRGHGGNGGTGGAVTTGVVEGGGGGGGGATAVLLNGGVVLVAGGGGGASQFDAGVDGTGNGTVKGLVAGGVGKLGQYQQEGGGGGGGGAVNGVGGGGALPGGGGTGYHHSSGNLVLNGATVTGTSNGLFGGGPGVDGAVSFTGVGIS